MEKELIKTINEVINELKIREGESSHFIFKLEDGSEGVVTYIDVELDGEGTSIVEGLYVKDNKVFALINGETGDIAYSEQTELVQKTILNGLKYALNVITNEPLPLC